MTLEDLIPLISLKEDSHFVTEYLNNTIYLSSYPNSPTDNWLNATTIGQNELYQKENDIYSLKIWLWEGIPKQFKSIVLFHEVKEAEFRLLNPNESISMAHEKAFNAHMKYAKKIFSEEIYDQFDIWQFKL